MEQKRLAQKVAVNDDSYDYLNGDDMPDSSPPGSNQETTTFNIITKTPTKRSKRIPSAMDTTTQNRIITILKNSSDYNDDSNDKTNINVVKHKEKKKRVPNIPKCRRCGLKFDTKVTKSLKKIIHIKNYTCILKKNVFTLNDYI